jgi:hypothetical protein
LVYKGNPKSGNIVCRIRVSISFQSAVTAFKHFAIAVGSPFFWVDMMATAASLGSVGRWDKDNWYASQDSFVGDEHSELIKRPVVSLSV